MLRDAAHLQLPAHHTRSPRVRRPDNREADAEALHLKLSYPSYVPPIRSRQPAATHTHRRARSTAITEYILWHLSSQIFLSLRQPRQHARHAPTLSALLRSP